MSAHAAGLGRALTPQDMWGGVTGAVPGDMVCWVALQCQRDCGSPGHGRVPRSGLVVGTIRLGCRCTCLSVVAFSSAWHCS